MKIVKHILDKKGRNVWSITPETKMFEALNLMAEKDVGALLVVEAGEVKGIITERDYARKVALKGKSSKDEPVKELMSTMVYFVHPKQSIEDCMALMSSKRIRHLPVIDDKNLIGIISIGDVVNAVISERELVIDQLVHYIKGSP